MSAVSPVSAIVTKLHHCDALPLERAEQSHCMVEQLWVYRLRHRNHRNAARRRIFREPPMLKARDDFAP